MAEGAIDGNAAMYELAGPHATAFAFSRFEGAEVSAVARGALAADADAASTDGAVETGEFDFKAHWRPSVVAAALSGSGGELSLVIVNIWGVESEPEVVRCS